MRRNAALIVCTNYNGALEPDQARLARVALMMFNDVILRAALEHRATVIELRVVCADPVDYANPIEPSAPAAGRLLRRLRARSGPSPASPPPRFLLADSHESEPIGRRSTKAKFLRVSVARRSVNQ